MADAALASSEAERAQSYHGCLVCLYTKSELRFEGFVFYLDCEERIIGLKNVKSYGTEGRRKDGPQVPLMENLSEYMYFSASDLKDLRVLSFPSANTTSDLPDDPAIIKPRSPHLPAAPIGLVTPSTFQAEDIDSNTQTGFQPPPFPGNLLPRSVGVFASQALTNYSHQFTMPQLPRAFMLTNATQQPMQHINMGASIAGSASNVTELPHPSMPPVSAGSLPFIATLPPPSSIQDSSASFARLFSNFTIGSMQNKASAMVNYSSEAVSSSDANPFVTPVTQTGQSLLHSRPIISRTESSTMGPSSSVELPQALYTQIHEPASPSHFINRRQKQNQGVRIHESNRGHFQGRGGHGNLKIRGPSHPQHYNVNPGRGYVLKHARYPHHDVGSHAYEGSSEPVYSKDEFFDSISSRSLDAQSAGKGNTNVTEQRRIDVETFGEIRNPQRGQGYGVVRPQRGGSTYRGRYRGRGSNTAERGRGANSRE